MQERIVVVFHGSPHLLRDQTGTYFDHASAMRTSAEVYGASLCSFGGETLGFDFGPDELDEALTFAIEHARVANPDLRMGVGIAQGKLRSLGDRGSVAGLSWGHALVLAEELARLAKQGDVLVDPDMPGVRSGELLTSGKRGVQLRCSF